MRFQKEKSLKRKSTCITQICNAMEGSLHRLSKIGKIWEDRHIARNLNSGYY